MNSSSPLHQPNTQTTISDPSPCSTCKGKDCLCNSHSYLIALERNALTNRSDFSTQLQKMKLQQIQFQQTLDQQAKEFTHQRQLHLAAVAALKRQIEELNAAVQKGLRWEEENVVLRDRVGVLERDEKYLKIGERSLKKQLGADQRELSEFMDGKVEERVNAMEDEIRLLRLWEGMLIGGSESAGKGEGEGEGEVEAKVDPRPSL